MKIFRNFLLWPALAFAFTLRAATNDVPHISGTVVDAQGNPVANASVDFYQYPTRPNFGAADMQLTQQTTTDSQGAFAFPAFNGMGFVVVTEPGLPPAWRTWYAAPQDPQKIALGAPSMLAGVVADDAGRPVADAEVWVSSAMNKTLSDNGQPNFVFGKISRQLFSTRTSDDGQFHIENFPADAQASLAVKKPGEALHQTANSLAFDELPFHAGQEDITLTLDPAGSVSGTVVARGTGQPLASVAVSLQPSAPGTVGYLPSQTAVSASDGTFQISDVPAGSYRVMAEFTNEPLADWVADPVPVTVAAGQSTAGVQMPAYKGGVVEVTVRGKNTHGLLAGAEVSMNSEGYSRGATTGTNGVAYFRLSPGQFNVFVTKQDWAQAQEQATVTDGQTTQVTVELAEPFKISGVARDTSGAPVSGANVGVFPNYGNGDSGTRTDVNGHYDLLWQEPSWAGAANNQNFYLLARDSRRKLAAIQEIDETTSNLDLTLKPAMSLSGRVQDPNGKPVTNAMAYIMSYQEDSSFSISRQRIPSDEQGRIHAEALPPGQRYGWYVSARGFGSAQEQMEAADPTANHYDFPTLVLKFANLKLAGRVLGLDGAPAAGVQIFMQGDGQPNGNAVTDADGRFAFDAVCEGPVTVTANSKGAYGQSEAMGGDTNVVIRFSRNTYTMAAPQTVTGSVFDANGNPAVGVRVIVTPSMGQVDVAKTDDSGTFTVTWQPQPGMRGAKYFAIARDSEHNLAAIEPINTDKTRVDLRLGPALSISGTVQDAKGAPLTRANINLNLMAGNMGGLVEYQRIKINPDGTFTIPALPMGERYSVFARADGHGSDQKNIGMTESKTNRIQLRPFKLKTADLQLAGQVLDKNGKPLPGAMVFINGKGQPNGNTQADGSGHFKFKVCDGMVQVYAFLQSGSGRNNSGMSFARGGDTDVLVKMGAQQRQRQVVVRGIPLKPRPWTLAALVFWPTTHKTGVIVLLSLQAAALLGTGGGIFWFTRKRSQG